MGMRTTSYQHLGHVFVQHQSVSSHVCFLVGAALIAVNQWGTSVQLATFKTELKAELKKELTAELKKELGQFCLDLQKPSKI